MHRPVFLLPLALSGLLLAACQKVACSSPDSGGTGFLEGHVRLEGPPPVSEPLPTSPSVTAVCGESVTERSLVVEKGGEIAYVVVALADGTETPGADPEAPSAVLEQRRCAFEPPVLAARAGTQLEVRNADALLHNVHALAGSSHPVLDVALPLEGSRVRRPLPTAPGILQLGCSLHPWMGAVLRTFEHPWFTTTDTRGRFRLEVPAGTHSVLFWHPRLPGVTRSVSVRAGQTVRLEHTWAAEDVRPPLQKARDP